MLPLLYGATWKSVDVGITHTYLRVVTVWKDEMGSNPSNTWTANCPMAVCHQSPDRTLKLPHVAALQLDLSNIFSFLQLISEDGVISIARWAQPRSCSQRGSMMMKLSSLWPDVKRHEHLSSCASVTSALPELLNKTNPAPTKDLSSVSQVSEGPPRDASS